ncbi:MAG TPA: ABC transporter permease [Bryobacteraceae bacterium]|nr:ABC transporter permease [Bryobacteraceae bacterium]
MMSALDEIKISLRGLARQRGFAIAAILSMALGAGANTTVFTLVNAVLLRPLPVADPDRLAGLFTVDHNNPGNLLCSYPNYKDYRDRNRVFSSLLLYSAININLTGHGAPESIVGQIVSGDYFQTLGLRMPLGRGFTADEDSAAGARPSAVIGYGLWTSKLGGDPGVLGRTIELNGRPFTIVGVAPRNFQGLDTLLASQLWIPMAMYRDMYPYPGWVEQRRALLFPVVGRLRPGVSLRAAEAAMQSIAADLQKQYPEDNEGRQVKLTPLGEATIAPNSRPGIAKAGLALAIVAMLVLLIACGNVANLLLARGAGRVKEMAVRLAMGANRWRVVRQLLIESTVLAVLGGAAGVLIALWARDVLWAMRPPMFTYSAVHLDLDYRVLGYALAVSIVAGVLFGLVPALRAARTDLASDLRERGAAERGGAMRSALVVAQVALSLVALIGAGLFTRSLLNASRVNMGFSPARLATVGFNLGDWGYDEERGREYERQALERAAAAPGVESAALAKDMPLTVGLARTVLLPGRENAGGRFTLTSVVGPGYLATMGIPLLAGRDFDARDGRDAPRVAIVNEACAAYYWPGESAVGKRMKFFGDSRVWDVIGVARNANYQSVGEAPQALIYLPLEQNYTAGGVVYIRARSSAAALEAAREAVQSVDPRMRLEAATVEDSIRQGLWAPRLTAWLLAAFGTLAVALSGIGIYGVISYSVSRKTREIGVRMALGAKPVDVQREIVVEGLRLVAAGVCVGLGVAITAARGVQSLLLATSARDALTFISAPSFLTLVGIFACWAPAYRATRIDPSRALRDE